MKRNIQAGGVFFSILLLAATSGRAGSGLFKPDDDAVTSLGAQVYTEHCASCHGKNLEGEPDWRTRKPDGKLPAPPHDATGHTWHHPDQVLFDLTKYGLKKFAGPDYETDMQAYEDVLSDEEIIAVLSYIKSTWPAEVRARHDDINARAK